MIQSKTVDAGVVALLAAAMVMPIAATEHAGSQLSADVALTTAASPADAFDLTGLLQAEVKAGEGLFNSVLGFPGALIGDVVNPVETALTDAAALNFGQAFSALAAMPVGLANTVIDLPIGLVEGLYNMVAVLPGQYLFNFGEAGSTGTGDAGTGVTGAGDTDVTGSTGDTGHAASSAAATAGPWYEPDDSAGPYFLNVQGLTVADLGDLMPMFAPLGLFGSTAMYPVVADFLPAIGDAFQLHFGPAFAELSSGLQFEGGLIANTVEPLAEGAAAISVLNPAYYLLDFDPFDLVRA